MQDIETGGSKNNNGGHNNSPYLNHSQAAVYLGVKVSSLYSLVSKGRIIPLKAGILNKYRAADLDAFLEECGKEAAEKRAKRKAESTPLEDNLN